MTHRSINRNFALIFAALAVLCGLGAILDNSQVLWPALLLGAVGFAVMAAAAYSGYRGERPQ